MKASTQFFHCHSLYINISAAFCIPGSHLYYFCAMLKQVSHCFSRILHQLLFIFDKHSPIMHPLCTAWVTGGMVMFFLLEQNRNVLWDVDMLMKGWCLHILCFHLILSLFDNCDKTNNLEISDSFFFFFEKKHCHRLITFFFFL